MGPSQYIKYRYSSKTLHERQSRSITPLEAPKYQADLDLKPPTCDRGGSGIQPISFRPFMTVAGEHEYAETLKTFSRYGPRPTSVSMGNPYHLPSSRAIRGASGRMLETTRRLKSVYSQRRISVNAREVLPIHPRQVSQHHQMPSTTSLYPCRFKISHTRYQTDNTRRRTSSG